MRALAAAVALAVLAAQPQRAPRWEPAWPLPGVVDVVGRSTGDLVAASNGGLLLIAEGPFQTVPGYRTAPGPEAYIAVSPGRDVTGAGCRFEPDDIFALELSPPARIVRVRPGSEVSTFIELPGVEFLSGIAFDTVGGFDHRLLVTARGGGRNQVLAVDCRGRVVTVAEDAPVVEGGIAVAPGSFGRFAGALIAPDELSGDLVAVRADGTSEVVLRPGLPAGGDLGVESLGFVPPRFFPDGVAYVADRASPGAPTEGTDVILRLPAPALAAAGVREGDLIAVTEAGGRTVAVRCAMGGCTSFPVAEASPAAHVEGHVTFVVGGAGTGAGPPANPIRPDEPPYLAIAAVSAGLGLALLLGVAIVHRRRHPRR